ncbi:MAG: methionyl-tRNA formyltransferase, partial [Solirubrobacteraceae bacterium]|nr:methionyl-tRNA formyltransferase [Solirubrobacteraceae bacterium]
PINADDSYGSLAPRLERIGGELLVHALDASPPFEEQHEAAATYADKIVAADRDLDPSRPAAELERIVRALHPHIGARVAVSDGAPLRVLAAAVRPAGPPQGELATGDGRLLLGCADGALELLVVQPPGRRPMDAAAYLRGHAQSRRADPDPGGD